MAQRISPSDKACASVLSAIRQNGGRLTQGAIDYIVFYQMVDEKRLARLLHFMVRTGKLSRDGAYYVAESI